MILFNEHHELRGDGQRPGRTASERLDPRLLRHHTSLACENRPQADSLPRVLGVPSTREGPGADRQDNPPLQPLGSLTLSGEEPKDLLLIVTYAKCPRLSYMTLLSSGATVVPPVSDPSSTGR